MSKVFMSDDQVNGILGYLTPNDTMLEYGSGGSTLFFSKYVKKYYSLEHEPKWYKDILEEVKDVSNIYYYHIMPNYGGKEYDCSMDKGNDLDTIFDKNLHGEWCISKEEYNKIKEEYPYAQEGPYSSIGRYWQYRDYVNYVSKLGVNTFDKVLIDGRARTFCAYKVLPFLNKDSLVFIDDFYRYSYGSKTRGEVDFGLSFFNLYEKVNSFDTMIVVRKRND